MADQDRDMHALDGTEIGQDIQQGSHVEFARVDEFEDRVHLDLHRRHRAHDASHVDLTQEEYTPEEVARLVGTSKEAVIHAITQGELKATREGRDIVCIDHHSVVEWLRVRSQGR